MKKKVTKKKVKTRKAKGKTGRLVNILGHRVSEDKLNSALKDVIRKRGVKSSLILERSMSPKEKLRSVQDGGSMYANVYKYAFF